MTRAGEVQLSSSANRGVLGALAGLAFPRTHQFANWLDAKAISLGRTSGKWPPTRIAGWSLFRPREDDIYVATYLKSGTTLLQMMVYQTVTDGSMDFPHIDCVSPTLEEALPSRDSLEDCPSPRILKTHLRRESVETIADRGKWLYMIRHPGDVVVSRYHHNILQRGRDLQFDSYFEHVSAEPGMWGSWVQHTRSWWPHRSDPNVLCLRYDETVADLRTTVARVSSFLGKALTEEEVDRITHRCSIAYMKQYDSKFDPRLRTRLWNPPTFIRAGRSGTWRDLSLEYQSRINEQITQVAATLPQDERESFMRLFSD